VQPQNTITPNPTPTTLPGSKPTSYPQAAQIADMLQSAQRVVIMQADNPDADSIGSALALEHILADMGKEPVLYCGVDIPGYLRHIEGWDRVQAEIPKQFDASIIVDTSTISLFEKLSQSGQKSWVATKPCVVLDHHAEVQNLIPFASVTLNDSFRSSTGELIFWLGQQLGWPLSVAAQANLMTAILGDTQGLSNQLTSADTYRAMAAMTEAGVDRPALEEARRETNKMPVAIFRYKSQLLARTELVAGGRIATVTIPQGEINQYSALYNPGPLVQPDMLQTQGVKVSIVLKSYDNGRITAAIRCNHGGGIGAQLAEHFGGGGHAYAAGFRIENGRPFNEIKSECMAYATQLLDTFEAAEKAKEETTSDETLQHTYA
jgi:bifunctional oligoribonuclease and PAP phosphatase NrnA